MYDFMLRIALQCVTEKRRGDWVIFSVMLPQQGAYLNCTFVLFHIVLNNTNLKLFDCSMTEWIWWLAQVGGTVQHDDLFKFSPAAHWANPVSCRLKWNMSPSGGKRSTLHSLNVFVKLYLTFFASSVVLYDLHDHWLCVELSWDTWCIYIKSTCNISFLNQCNKDKDDFFFQCQDKLPAALTLSVTHHSVNSSCHS